MTATSIKLPALPENWQPAAAGELSETAKRSIEPIGPGFLAHARRTLRGRTFSEDEKIEAERNVKQTEDGSGDDAFFDDHVDPYLLKHDPKDWKSADQYAVLGLGKLRWRATDDNIRRAHRRQVLRHHPDKKAAEGVGDEDGFFKLIQKAFETLTDPAKRRQFDSIDSAAEVPVSKKDKEFFARWAPVFEAEGRFSTKKPVPELGTIDTPKPEVDAFYNFWYNFDSWRSFEWLDEDVPDDSSNRDNKRYIEKKNKAARNKRKKDDNGRIHKLVDTALNEDPRIKLFKEAEKKAKAQRKWERESGSREQAEREAKEKAEAEAKAKQEAEDSKKSKESAKKAKEAAKSAKKKNKRAIRNSLGASEFLGTGKEDPLMLTDVDRLVETLSDEGLAETATKLVDTSAENVRNVLTEAMAKLSLGAQYFKS